jgi:hypothetical protein
MRVPVRLFRRFSFLTFWSVDHPSRLVIAWKNENRALHFDNSKPAKPDKLPSFLDDCDRPACDDMMSMLKAASGRVRENEKKKKIALHETVQPDQTSFRLQCPPKSAELGSSSWTLLHTMVRGTEHGH